jgi:hypothetical protein
MLLSMWMTLAPSVTAEGSGNINIKLRGCPEGVSPLDIGNPAAVCTIPLDAPADAGVAWGGDGQGGIPLMDAKRLHNGSYLVLVPADMTVRLFGFEPSVYDAYTFVGADSMALGDAEVTLSPSGYRSITVYYYHLEPGLSATTLDITLRGCPEGVNPLEVAVPADVCTIPLDAPDEAGVAWGGDGQGGMPLADTERLSSGTYRILAPADREIRTFNFEPTVYDTYTVVGADDFTDGEATMTLAEGESRRITFYYFFEE